MEGETEGNKIVPIIDALSVLMTDIAAVVSIVQGIRAILLLNEALPMENNSNILYVKKQRINHMSVKFINRQCLYLI